MVKQTHSFHLLDYCIFVVTIAISLGIGIYYALSGGKQRTTSEYFVGNRKMAILPVAISLMVSFESSIMMLGIPAEIYVYGMQWIIGNIGFCVANVLSIIIIVPLIHPLKITSAYEYLEMRFDSHAVRILGTILGMLSYIGYMGVVLFGPALALDAVTGLPQWISIVSIAVASAIYTAIGGLKAVIWTDVFQCAVMFAGFFAVLIKGTIDIGGVQKTWEVAYDKGRINLFNFDPDPTVRHTFWNLFFGSVIRGFGLVFNQSSIQRISSTPTLSAAKKVLYLVAPAFFISLLLAAIEGVIAYVYYDIKGCDPLASDQIANSNQIIPFMVMDIFEGLQGMPGLFMASLFSASLSTLSSGLSSLSALLWTDLVKPHTKPMTELTATIISKLAVIIFGGLSVFVAIMISHVGGTLVQITSSVLSAFAGPLTGLFMFGAFCPWGNGKGAFWGAVISTITTFIIVVGQMSTKGSVKNTKLPSGPIDFCPALNITTSYIMTNMTSYGNETDHYAGHWMNNSTTTMTSMLGASDDYPEPTGFSRVFMVSYVWFGAIGIIQVMLFGTIISFLTGYKKPGEVERKYVIPFFDSLFPFLPNCLLKPLRCGYTYPEDDQEKSDAVDDREGGIYNTEFDVDNQDADLKPPMEKSETIINETKLTNEIKNGNLHSFNGDVINTATKADLEKQATSEIQHQAATGDPSDVPNDATVSKDDSKDKSKSYGDLSPPLTSPVRDVEVTLVKADSSNVNAGFIETENNTQGLVMKLRAKSVEMNIEKM